MGFLDQVRQGAQRTAWEAERVVRQNRANSAVGDARRDLDAQIFNLGKALLESYKGGAAPSIEAAPIYEQIQAQEARIAQLEQEAEAIKQEQPPQGAPSAPTAQQAYTPPPPAPGAYVPPAQGGYGQPAPGAPPTAPTGSYQPAGPAPAAYTPPAGAYQPTGPAPAYTPPPSAYAPTGPAPGPAAPAEGATATTAGDAVQAAATAMAAPVTECPNCHTPRADMSAAFCGECGTRYA